MNLPAPIPMSRVYLTPTQNNLTEHTDVPTDSLPAVLKFLKSLQRRKKLRCWWIEALP